MRSEEFVESIAASSSGLMAVHQTTVDDWLPETPPITILFGAFGRRIAEDFQEHRVDAKDPVFRLIEQAMERGDPYLSTAVATGLIEAMANRALQTAGQWESLKLCLGPRSLSHAENWLAF